MTESCDDHTHSLFRPCVNGLNLSDWIAQQRRENALIDPPIRADYVPGVAITTADPPNRYRPNGVHVDVPDHLAERVAAYYAAASLITPNHPIIITEA